MFIKPFIQLILLNKFQQKSLIKRNIKKSRFNNESKKEVMK
jgi:hypothetical protein